MYAWGYSLAGWIGFGCYFIQGSNPHAQAAWRFPLAFQIVFPIVLLAGSNLIPFSPRWLLSKGRREEAWAVIRRIHKTPNDVNDIRAREEFYLIEKQYEKDKSLQVRPFEIFRTGPNRRRALVGFLLMWGDQFLGYVVLIIEITECGTHSNSTGQDLRDGTLGEGTDLVWKYSHFKRQRFQVGCHPDSSSARKL